MTLPAYVLRARQSRAGQPINIVATQRSTSHDDDYPYWGLGLTSGATAPATRAAVLHADALPDGWSASFWDRASQMIRTFFSGGARTAWSDIQTVYKRKALDANYVAGRYLWLVAFADDPGSSGDVPVAAVGPYHIT